INGPPRRCDQNTTEIPRCAIAHLRFDAEPVNGPRFAGTRWHRPGMTESIEIVITGLDPVIHLLRKNLLRRWMDARIKSGHDERVLSSTLLSQDAERLETVIASERVAQMRAR
ncbi:MAG TPA: hypothetical protein VK678_07590, partial [Bradyrhizobium sp.]|nr:hypothetical protein [Bradyrhizobium sp.]